MSEISTKQAAENVFAQFTPLVEKKYGLSEKARERFLNLCALVDVMDGEFGSENISIDVSPVGISGKVVYDISDIEFMDGASHPFFRAIRNADLVRISNVGGELIRIEFIVNDLWVKK